MRVNFEPTQIEGVWHAEANEQGPAVAIFGGVHGSEQTGIEVVKQTLDGIDIEAGQIFLALGNLAAIAVNQRHTGVNLNRLFRDLTPEELENIDNLPYEYGRAQELNKILDYVDGLLDLHDFTDPEGPIFLITEQRGFDVARAIGAPTISSGWSVTEFGGSDSRMEAQEKIGLCYELGDKTKPIKNLSRGIGARDRFLEQMGLREKVSIPMYDNPIHIHTDEAILRQPGRFVMGRGDFKTFEPLEEGQLIAVNGNTVYFADKGQVIIFPPKEIPKIGEEAFSFGHEIFVQI